MSERIYPKGHLLSVRFPLYYHVGISDGEGGVYENSRARSGRGLVTLEAFASEKDIIDHGLLPGSKPANDIIDNAKELVADQKKYHLLNNNCEHFVHEVCGVTIASPQIRRAFVILATLFVNKFTSGRLKTALFWSIASQLSHINENSFSWWKHALFTSAGFWLVFFTGTEEDA